MNDAQERTKFIQHSGAVSKYSTTHANFGRLRDRSCFSHVWNTKEQGRLGPFQPTTGVWHATDYGIVLQLCLVKSIPITFIHLLVEQLFFLLLVQIWRELASFATSWLEAWQSPSFCRQGTTFIKWLIWKTFVKMNAPDSSQRRQRWQKLNEKHVTR